MAPTVCPARAARPSHDVRGKVQRLGRQGQVVHDRLVEAPEADAVEEHAVRGPPAPEVLAAGRQPLIRPNNAAVWGFGPWRTGSVRSKLRTVASAAQ